MLVHTVVFWLRPDLNVEERAAFLHDGLESLRPIKSVRALYVGSPAPVAPRPVVDASYDFALTVLFDDLEAHNAYQADPLHLAFINRFKSSWARVQIYDMA